MAQDHSDTTGQQPNGYDYQQPWYPQSNPAEGSWDTTGYPTQYGPGQGFGGESYGSGTGYGENRTYGWQGQSAGAQQWTGGTAQQPYYADPYAQPAADPYTADPYTASAAQDRTSSLYAPPGAEQTSDGYLAQSTDTGSDTGAGFTVPFHTDAAPAAEPADSVVDAVVDSVVDSVVDAVDEPPANPSPVDRIRTLVESVISADHAPSRRAFAIRAGAGVAALAVLITAGVLATGSDDAKPDSAAGNGPTTQNISVAHSKAWTAQPPAAAPAGTDDTLVGSWLLADTVVRADGAGIQAYNLADGKPGWAVAPPANGAVPCGLSPTVNAGGLGAAVYRASADPKSPCTSLVVIDTKTGKAAWSKPLSDAKGAYTVHVAVLDDKVVAVGDDKALAWASADGKDLWQYAGPGQYCTLGGSTAGTTVLLHSNCADSTPADQAIALNAADGKLKWWRGLNNQPKTVTVLSAEPAVVLTTGAQPTDDRVFAWGASGEPAAEIPVSSDAGRLAVDHGAFDPLPGVYFRDQTMISTLVPPDGGAPAVIAYDLTTGKPAWKTAVAEKGKAKPVGLDGGGLLVAVDERIDQPAHISRFALAGGQETQGGAFPQGTGSLLTAGRLLTGGGKVVSVPAHAANFGTATAYQSKG